MWVIALTSATGCAVLIGSGRLVTLAAVDRATTRNIGQPTAGIPFLFATREGTFLIAVTTDE